MLIPFSILVVTLCGLINSLVYVLVLASLLIGPHASFHEAAEVSSPGRSPRTRTSPVSPLATPLFSLTSPWFGHTTVRAARRTRRSRARRSAVRHPGRLIRRRLVRRRLVRRRCAEAAAWVCESFPPLLYLSNVGRGAWPSAALYMAVQKRSTTCKYPHCAASRREQFGSLACVKQYRKETRESPYTSSTPGRHVHIV